MAENSVVRARINGDIKEKAAAVLDRLGLTVSDVMRMVLTRVAHEEALPFDLAPNRITIETLEKSERGEEIHKANDAADLYAKLGI